MLSTNGRLKIAIQKDGRVLASSCTNFDLDILAMRDDDIPQYVQEGVADLGIVGENILTEKQSSVDRLLRLGFGVCTLVLSVPDGSSVGSAHDLSGKRIATTYPQTLQTYLADHAVEATITRLSGSVELAPSLDVADAICDIVSTGATLRMNGLRPLETVLRSEAVLAANPSTMNDPSKSRNIERLLIRMKASLEARGKRYLMMNAPSASVGRIREIIPSLKSPTIVPLADSDMVAVHSVVAEDTFWDVMEQLTEAGASDIVVVPIEAIIR
jgi:ATP phosphoribosyltransferase